MIDNQRGAYRRVGYNHLISSKNQERKAKIEKRDKREEKGTRVDHMTERKRRQNLAKFCSVSLQS